MLLQLPGSVLNIGASSYHRDSPVVVSSYADRDRFCAGQHKQEFCLTGI